MMHGHADVVTRPARASPATPTSAWRTTLARLASDWFLIGMVLAVLIASAAPGLGRSGGMLHVDTVADWGVFTIFFLHGIGLSTERLRQGLARWPVHIVVQFFTFGVFPAIAVLLTLTVGHLLPRDLLLGFIYLCALPSTVSSSVAMTSLARGNVAAAIFNATFSTLVGVLLTPLLVSLLAGPAATGGVGSLASVVLNVATLLLLPFAIGQALRPPLGSLLARWKPWTGAVDRGVILLLVFGAFSDSVADGLWSRHGISLLGTTVLLTGAMLAVVLWLSREVARKCDFTVEDEIATVFCGSKKTLASGVPMARVLFGGDPAIGVIMLPIMFYHQLQLFVCSLLAQRYARRPGL